MSHYCVSERCDWKTKGNIFFLIVIRRSTILRKKNARLKSENQSMKIKLEEMKKRLSETEKISNETSDVSESNEKKLKLFQYKSR